MFPNPKNESCKWTDIYEKGMLSEDPVKLTSYSQALDKWFEVSVFYLEKDFCLIKFEDITKRKKIERANGGIITSQSQEGRGAKFILELLIKPNEKLKNKKKK